MSKELECLDRIDKRNYLTEREHKEFLGVVEQAIKEYEAIKNAEPSEALVYLNAFIEENNNDIKNQDITGFDIDTQAKWVKYLEHKSFMFSTIKQALLKAQEPKQYLKWEDLEFPYGVWKNVEVVLNGTKYTLNCYKNCSECTYVKIYLNGIVVADLCSTYKADKQFFNDLHLERVEE